MSSKKLKKSISAIFILVVFSSLFSLLVFASLFPSVVEAADIEAVTDSNDGSSAFVVKSLANVEQAHVDSTGNLVTKGCVRVDSGLIECSETEGLIVDGNVGVGTVNPLSKLQVAGGLSRFGLGGTADNVSGTGEVYIQSNLEVDGTIYGDASGLFNFPPGTGGWVDGGTNVYQAATTDLVGIGTTTPSTTLEIVKQGTSAPLMISSVFTGDGDIFAVSPAGNVGIGTINPQEILDLAGRIFLANTSAPVPTTNRIYAVGGNIFWNGIQLDTGATVSGWIDGGTNVYNITTTDNVGIGTTTPNAATLEIVKNAAQPPLKISGTATGAGDFLYVGSSGNIGIGTTTPVAGLTVMSGNVGIGTWSPIGSLEVRGMSATRIWTGAGTDTNAISAGELYVEGDLEVDGTIYGDGSGITALPAGLAAGGWTDDGTVVRLTTGSDNVGIGTTTPVGGLAIMNGNVGIGTWSPAFALNVIGNVGIGQGAGNASLSDILEVAANAGSTAGAFRSILTIDDTTPMAQGVGAGIRLRGLTSFGNTTFAGIWAEKEDGVAGNTAGSLHFTARSADTNARMSITSTGNVGIGTTAPVGGLTVMAGNVGIGTWSPIGQLEVRGGSGATRIWTGAGTDTNATAAGELYVEGDLEVDGTIYGDGSGITALPAGLAAGGWIDGGTNVYQTTTSDKVGIGTTTPATTLEIVKQSSDAPLMISSTATGAGDLFIIASSGNVGLGTTNTTLSAFTIMNGNVGIGTINPRARLGINGDVNLNYNVLNFGGLADDDSYQIYVTNDTLRYDAFNFHVFTTGLQGSEVERMRITAAGRMGIGTSTPLSNLTLAGSQSIGAGYLQVAAPTNGLMVEGSVAIGTTSPTGKLDVRGDEVRIWTGAGTDTNATAAGELYVEGDLEVDGTIYGDGSGITALPASLPAGGWTDGGTNVYTSTTTDNVGIGTTTPTSTLEIVKTAAGTAPFLISTVATADGDVLKIDSAGNVGIGTTMTLTAGVSIMNGNVGIGTWDPISRLEIATGQWGQFALSNSPEAGSGSVKAFLVMKSGTPDSYVSLSLNRNPATGLFGETTKTTAEITLTALNGDSNIRFLTIPTNNTVATERMRIDANGNVGIGTGTSVGALAVMNGNVGIGTWSPTQRLQVIGDVSVTDEAYGGTWDGSFNVPTKNAVYDQIQSIVAGGAGGWVDGGTNVYTATTTDNVGIGTTTPNAATLEIVKNAAQPPLKISSSALGAGDFFKIDSAGNIGIGTTTPVAGLTVMSGNVGIGTWSPIGSLEVRGMSATRIWTGTGTDTNATAAGELYVEGDLEVDGTIYGDGSGITALPSGLPAGGWTDGGTNVYLTLTTDNVGIGTTTPATTFEIIKTSSRDPLMVSSVPTGAGDYLIVRSSGNVGIGTVLPTATLTVNGTVSMEPSTTANITAGGGVTVTRTVMRIQGSGGAIDISANPQIAVAADGQIVILQGMSNANTVLFENGTGLRLQGGVPFTMGLGDTLTLVYDTSAGLWTEVARVDN